MKTLCVNSSDTKAQVALILDNSIENFYVENPHSEFLLPKISEILDAKNFDVTDFDNYAVVVGPGSFTGIRIAVSIIKAMAVVNTKANLIKISNFDLIAFNQKQHKNFLVALYSGNEDLYVCEYQDSISVKTFALNSKLLMEYAKENNLTIYASLLEKDKLNNLEANFIEVKSETLALLSQQMIDNQNFVSIDHLTPIYVKLSQAEKQLKEKVLNQIIIEKATNVDEVLDIENNCFEEKWSKETLLNEISLPNKHYLIAKYNNEIVGYIGVEECYDELSLLKVGVKENFRNYGVGTKLLSYTIDLQKQKGLKKYFLEVNVNNIIAKNLYKKLGFKQVSIRKNYYKNGDDCLVMLLED